MLDTNCSYSTAHNVSTSGMWGDMPSNVVTNTEIQYLLYFLMVIQIKAAQCITIAWILWITREFASQIMITMHFIFSTDKNMITRSSKR